MPPRGPRKIPQDMPQPEEKRPEKGRQDLNPDAMAGQNVGMAGPHPEKQAPTAYDLKEVHRRFQELTDDELKQIPILPEGSRLEQGATYIDLRNIERGELTATGGMEADPDNWYVPKSEVPYEIWNRLLGAKTPERSGIAFD